MARGRKRKGRKETTTAKQSGDGAETSAELDLLAKEYRSFKDENPARAARVPDTVKAKAQAIYQAGTPYSRIATALSLSPGAVKAWLGETKIRRGRPSARPGRRLQGATAGSRQDWVKIRVEGREVEVAKGDFWSLVKSGVQATH